MLMILCVYKISTPERACLSYIHIKRRLQYLYLELGFSNICRYFSPTRQSITEIISDFPVSLGTSNTIGLFSGNEIAVSSMNGIFVL